jgi:hypothetical protein
LIDLFDELKALVSGFEAGAVDYALCGGLALAVHAIPRATVDIDVLVPASALERAKVEARRLGFVIEANPMKFAKGAVEIHRLSKIDADSGDLLMLDLLVVTSKTQRAWESREELELEHGRLFVVSKTGLIALKSLRGSGQDKEDIRQLKKKPRRR